MRQDIWRLDTVVPERLHSLHSSIMHFSSSTFYKPCWPFPGLVSLRVCGKGQQWPSLSAKSSSEVGPMKHEKLQALIIHMDQSGFIPDCFINSNQRHCFNGFFILKIMIMRNLFWLLILKSLFICFNNFNLFHISLALNMLEDMALNMLDRSISFIQFHSYVKSKWSQFGYGLCIVALDRIIFSLILLLLH